MAARDSEHDVERGFGTGLRAQLGKRVQAGVGGIRFRAGRAGRRGPHLEPASTVIAAADREELNEERAALDERAQGLVDTKQELDAREARMAERGSRSREGTSGARAARRDAMLREVKHREQGLEERQPLDRRLEKEVAAHRRDIEANAGRRSVELLAEREAIQAEIDRLHADGERMSEERDALGKERAEARALARGLDGREGRAQSATGRSRAARPRGDAGPGSHALEVEMSRRQEEVDRKQEELDRAAEIERLARESTAA